MPGVSSLFEVAVLEGVVCVSCTVWYVIESSRVQQQYLYDKVVQTVVLTVVLQAVTGIDIATARAPDLELY